MDLTYKGWYAIKPNKQTNQPTWIITWNYIMFKS